MTENEFNSNVFVNCPFDDEFSALLKAMLFTILHCGFTPRISLENTDSSINRLDKIQGLIKESKYSIHDISRCKASKKGEFYRLNMPFEIGLDFGCKRFGTSTHQTKEILILEKEQYRYQKAISDLAGIDIQVHKGEVEDLVRCVRNWFYTKKASVKQYTTIWDDYNEFVAHLEVDLNKKDVIGMPIPEFIDKAREYIVEICES